MNINPTATYHRAHASVETAQALFNLLHAAGLHEAATMVYEQLQVAQLEYQAAKEVILAPWALAVPATITEDEAASYELVGEAFACCARM